MKTQLDPRFDQSPHARLKRFAIRIINTRYFFIALLLHVLLLAFFKGKVIFEELQRKGIIETKGDLFVVEPSKSPNQPLPPPPPPKETESAVNEGVAKDIATSAKPNSQSAESRVLIAALSSGHFQIRGADFSPSIDRGRLRVDQGAKERAEMAEEKRVQQAYNFHREGIEGENGSRGITYDPSTHRIKKAIFTCYVGKYKGGDWDCNFGFIADHRWYGNCIYNLMLQIQRWTKGAVKAQLKPEVLELASRDWLDRVKPPYVFFTGHQDFILDESEVQNLREYLMLGGALWIDNSLPGQKSRFDLAVRREMRKVLPGCDFEKLGANHPLYTSYYSFSGGPPAGMNFYREPVEVIKIGAGGGDVAVLYTLNAYSDLWETGLTEKDTVDREAEWSPELQRHIHRIGNHLTPGDWAWQQHIFYRNVNEPTVLGSYKFGINIVYYLLTRYQDRFMRLPSSTI